MKQNINVKPEIVYQEEKKSPLLAAIWDLLILLLLQVGMVDSVRIWTQMDNMTMISLYAILTVVGMVMVVAYHGIHFSLSGMIPLCAAVVAGIVKGIGSVYYGIFGSINYLISYWNVRYEDGISLFMEDSIQKEDIHAFVIVMLLLVMALFWRMLRQKSLVRICLVPMLCILIGLILGEFSAIGCSTFLIGWLGVWLSKIRNQASSRRLIWLVVISVMMMGATILSGQGQLTTAVQFKEKVKMTADEIRYGKDTLPQGDLAKAADLLVGDNPTLRVTTGQEKDMYLKGFVGSRYADGRWSELPKSAYKGEQSGMLQWLQDMDFIPQSQYADYVGLDNVEKLHKNSVEIENVGANRSYLYTPYSVNGLSGMGIRANRDDNYMATTFTGKRTYQFDEWSGSKPGELIYANTWLRNPLDRLQKQYAKAENVYANFVYAQYLDVDPEMADMIQQIFFEGYQAESEQTIYDVTERIRDVLGKKAAYREQPEIAPDGVEPISWFLNKGHQGNAVLFASAAVQAYRVQGIPARYVEGYLVRQEEVAQSSGKVTLTNQNSHAWVEVYLDGVGWIPIDVTPGFYYDTYTLLQMVKRPQNVSQTAAADESDQQGDEIEDETNKASKNKEDKNKESVTIVIDGVIDVLFVIVLLYALLEISYVLAIMGIEKRYGAFSLEKKTQVLESAILRMMEIYGYPAKIGWNVEATDQLLAEQMPQFYLGEYIRVTQIIEKHIYGQQDLQPQEIGVLYVFAVRLYEARTNSKLRTRIRIRYFFMNPVRRAMLSWQK